jgi:hypothetical protein
MIIDKEEIGLLVEHIQNTMIELIENNDIKTKYLMELKDLSERFTRQITNDYETLDKLTVGDLEEFLFFLVQYLDKDETFRREFGGKSDTINMKIKVLYNHFTNFYKGDTNYE